MREWTQTKKRDTQLVTVAGVFTASDDEATGLQCVIGWGSTGDRRLKTADGNGKKKIWRNLVDGWRMAWTRDGIEAGDREPGGNGGSRS